MQSESFNQFENNGIQYIDNGIIRPYENSRQIDLYDNQIDNVGIKCQKLFR